MKLARVVGNVVSTVKDACYTGQKLMIIDYIDENGSLTGNQAIAFDVADAGIGRSAVSSTTSRSTARPGNTTEVTHSHIPRNR